jgi:hypothetical protein
MKVVNPRVLRKDLLKLVWIKIPFLVEKTSGIDLNALSFENT